MRNFLVLVCAVAITSTTARATTIGLQWADRPGQQFGYGGTVNVVLTDLLPGDSVSAILFDYNTVFSLRMSWPTATPPGWEVGGNIGPLQPGTFYAINALSPANNLDHTFSGVVGTFDIHEFGSFDVNVHCIQ